VFEGFEEDRADLDDASVVLAFGHRRFALAGTPGHGGRERETG
jgi:hypothetical protein